VVTGRLTVLTQKPGETKIERVVLNPGDLMMHEPGEVHALIADEETIFLAFAEGLRQGEDYLPD
jgi:quercetin dioxygenase-like cupin family protein